jgi:hypothetical protein
MTPAPTTDPIKDRASRTDSLPMLARARLFAFAGLLPVSCLNVPPPDAGETGIDPTAEDGGIDGDDGGDGGDDDGVDDGVDDGIDDGGEKLDVGAATLDGTSSSGSDSSTGSDSGTDDPDGSSSGSTTDEGSSGTTGDGSSSTGG